MFLLLFGVVLLVSSVNSDGITAIMDLPLTMPTGSFMIHATLLDQSNGNKYYMQELISSKTEISGSILISTPKSTFNVYYNFKDQDAKDNYERLVIEGTNCSLYNFKKSPPYLPGISNQVINYILAMGPSILYRIDHSTIIWNPNPDEDVRGTTMKSFKATINDRLTINYYYKSNLDEQSGLQQPSRVSFNGSDISRFGLVVTDRLVLDIYLQEKDTKNDFAKLVQPTPGIGCPVYYAENLPMPTLNTHLVHMILSETITGSTTTKTVSEIHAYDTLKLLRLQTSILGISTEALYDYTLGIVFMLQDGGYCSLNAAAITSPGIDLKSGEFSLETLFQFNGVFNYLGEMYFERRAGFLVKVWESVQYDVTTSTGKWDKAVITQYFTETTSTDAFDGYLLVSTIINGYKLDTSKNYQLIETTIRDYMDFQSAETESEFHDKFTLAGCKYFVNDMTLTFQLGCTEPDCIKFAENQVYTLKERFREALLENYDLSPLRVSEMDITFSDSTIDITVDFLEAPNLENTFASHPMLVTDDTLKLLSTTTATSALTCFNRLSSSFETFDVAMYCPQDNVCGSLNGIDRVKEDDNGQVCQVVQVALHNYRRISREIANKDLQASLIRDTVYKVITLTDRYTNFFIEYKVIDILDVTRSQSHESQNLFDVSVYGQSLDDQDENVVVVPYMKTFGDCYRACESSEELECRTLSYCSNAESTNCLVTNMTAIKAPIAKTRDENCNIYQKNALLEYSTVQNRRFKVPLTISEAISPKDCASECAATESCHSFQYCSRICILGEQYTDSSTEYDEDCLIYIPKVTEKYQATGRKMIEEVFSVEFNLTIDQCAALCYDWTGEEGEDSCLSFNFCPKGVSTSSCSLTKYSIKDSTTKTVEANYCFNYELIDSKTNSKQNTQSTSTYKKGTSGVKVFGIIVIFLVTGLIFGIVLPYVYPKVHTLIPLKNQSYRADQRFIWTRKEDEPES